MARNFNKAALTYDVFANKRPLAPVPTEIYDDPTSSDKAEIGQTVLNLTDFRVWTYLGQDNTSANTWVLGSQKATTATAASPTAAVTSNSYSIVATFTGFTTAAAGSQAFTINNSLITLTSGVEVTVTSLNASGNLAVLTLDGIVQAEGSIIVNVTNNGAGALGAGDNVIISVKVIN